MTRDRPKTTSLWPFFLGALAVIFGGYSACIPELQCWKNGDCPRTRDVCIAGICKPAPIAPKAELTAELTAESNAEAAPEDAGAPPDTLGPEEPYTTPEATPEAFPEAHKEPTPPEPQPSCQVGNTRPCYTGSSGCTKSDSGSYTCEGICKGGIETCVNGVWSACENQVLPSIEQISNRKDDNCDGRTDETNICLSTKPYLFHKVSGTLQTIAFHPNDYQLAVGTNQGVSLWDTRDPQKAPTSPSKQSPTTMKSIVDVVYVLQKPTVLIYAIEGQSQFKEWDTTNNKVTNHTTPSPLHALLFSPTGLLYYATGNKLGRWWWLKKTFEPGEAKFPTGENHKITKIMYQAAVGNTPANLLVGHEYLDKQNNLTKQAVEHWNPSTKDWTRGSDKATYTNGFLKDFTPIPTTRNVMVAQLNAGLYVPGQQGTNHDITDFSKKDYIHTVSAHPTSTWLTFGTTLGNIYFYHWRARKILKVLKHPSQAEIKAILISPQGNYLAAITEKELQVWTCQ